MLSERGRLSDPLFTDPQAKLLTILEASKGSAFLNIYYNIYYFKDAINIFEEVNHALA